MVLPYFPLRWGVLGVRDWGSRGANRVILPPALRGYNCRPEKYPFRFGTREARALVYVAKWTCGGCVHVWDKHDCTWERDVEMIRHLHERYHTCVLLERGGWKMLHSRKPHHGRVYLWGSGKCNIFLGNIFYFMSVVSKCFPIGLGVCVNE